jgi:anti-sigma regulatory factor (Ser/Thr protein kinase)
VSSLKNTLEYDFDAGITFLTASGILDAPEAIRLRRVAARILTDHAPVIVIDLSGVGLASARALNSVTSLAAAGAFVVVPPGLRPLVDRPGSVLPDRPSAAAAATAALERGLRVRAAYEAGEHVPTAARTLVARACAGWRQREICDDAQVIISELVTNAVVHAGGRIRVAVERSRKYMHLYVTDGGDNLPQLPSSRVGFTPSTGRPGGLGLGLVESLADAWGTVVTHHGKTVWARLRFTGAGWQTSHQYVTRSP